MFTTKILRGMLKPSKVGYTIGALTFGTLFVYNNHKAFDDTLQLQAKQVTNLSKTNHPTSNEYPNLETNKNIMSRCLNREIYAKLRHKQTSQGFTLDQAIQTGVDNSGVLSFSGCIAGDEETYTAFAELFDKIIEIQHKFKPNQKHKTDFKSTTLDNSTFDQNYVLSVRMRTIRNIRGFSLPPFISRGERRDVEEVIVRSLYKLDDIYNGTYFGLEHLNDKEIKIFKNVKFIEC
jgi:creatine kinase